MVQLTAFCIIFFFFIYLFFFGRCSFGINPKIVIDNQRVNAYVLLQVLAKFSVSFLRFRKLRDNFREKQQCMLNFYHERLPYFISYVVG